MRELGTKEASLHYPPSNTRLEAEPVLLVEAKWKHRGQNESRKKSGGTEEGQGMLVSRGPLEALLAPHLCATQWPRGDCPLWGGWPLETLWRADGAMFVG